MPAPVRANLVIRGGKVIDGSGAPAFVGDIAIDGDFISAVGPDLQVAGSPQEIDARGLLVAPGWIDVHTHYDAQATWDPLLKPSSQCGVTTMIMGNCGVGFAPCQKELRKFLIDLMEAVEDIPGTALHEGIQWEWETFPEYLDALGRRQYASDVAVMVGHGGVRTWVMGHRANVSDMPGGPEKDPVTHEEIEKIAGVVREAVSAGALGFSTSRLLLHRDNKGILTPGALAAKQELLRICDAVVEGGGGIFEMSTDFSTYDDVPYHKMDNARREKFAKSELNWMAEAMQKHDQKLRVTFGIGGEGAKFWSQWLQKTSAWPGQCVLQFSVRPQALHMAHDSGRHMFAPSKHWRKAKQQAGDDVTKLKEILRVPSTRKAIMDDMANFKSTGELGSLGFGGEMYKNDQGWPIPSWMITGDKIYPWTDTYEPTAETMVSAIAARSGQTPLEISYDLLLDTNGPHAGILWRPLFPYNGSSEPLVAAFDYDNIIPGFDDAGAHGTILTDATAATSTLSYFGRDRTLGRRVPLEKLVKTQTRDAAAIFGLTDRGELKAGMRADLNIIDLDKLKVKAPFWANDLPTKAGRWLQDVEGYRATILRGIVTFQDGQHSGQLPGRLVRNPHSVPLDEEFEVVPAIRQSDAQNTADLREYAVELSRNGGASAQARVMREEEEKLERSRL